MARRRKVRPIAIDPAGGPHLAWGLWQDWISAAANVDDRRVAEPDHVASSSGIDGFWVVWRQGDDGNPFEVARLSSRTEAEVLAATMEARGHRQTYWIAPLR